VEWIVLNWQWVVGALILLATVVRLIYKKSWKPLVKVALDSIILMSTNTKLEGKAKMDAVVDDVFNIIPVKYGKFIQKKYIKFFVQGLYNRLQGKINKKSPHIELLRTVSEDIAKSMVQNAVEDFAGKLINTDEGGNFDIVSNNTISTFKDEVTKGLELRAYSEISAEFDKRLKGKGRLGLNLIKRF